MAASVLDVKLPDEKWFVDFDFTSLFRAGVTIASNTLSFAISVDSGADPNVGSMPSGVPTVSGMVASQLVRNGVAGTRYLLQMHAVGSDGSEQDIQLILPVASKRLG